MKISLHTDPIAITPLFPEEDMALRELAIDLMKGSSSLSTALHPITRDAIARLVEPMNSYYSNLIEGHNTHPLDIENALNEDYSKEPDKKLLQLESFAHVKTHKRMKELLRNGEKAICLSEFIKWLHCEFYKEMPIEFHVTDEMDGTKVDIVPGEFRVGEVKVGRHIGPAAKSVNNLMDYFSDAYDPGNNNDSVKRIISIAASHHRLAWIHPFQDGNGRVVRLFSEALFIKEEIDSGGLWCISRGLAIYNKRYISALHNADHSRQGDYDGRGNLSSKFLQEFCTFFLETALDQINYMKKILDIDSSLERISNYFDLMVVKKVYKPEAVFIFKEAFLRGKISRGEAMRLAGKKESTSRAIMKSLIDEKLLIEKTEGRKHELYINFPVKVAPYLFPKLYPKDIEATIAIV